MADMQGIARLQDRPEVLSPLRGETGRRRPHFVNQEDQALLGPVTLALQVVTQVTRIAILHSPNMPAQNVPGDDRGPDVEQPDR